MHHHHHKLNLLESLEVSWEALQLKLVHKITLPLLLQLTLIKMKFKVDKTLLIFYNNSSSNNSQYPPKIIFKGSKKMNKIAQIFLSILQKNKVNFH
jgi:hypothetical protein